MISKINLLVLNISEKKKDKEVKEKEDMSLKKAIKSVQNDFKDKFIGVEYISKKGKKIIDSVRIPIGRRIRQAIITEAKKIASKARKV